MSPAPPVRSTPLQRAQSYAAGKEAARVNEPAKVPFYLVGFRNRILRLVQDFYSRPDNFPKSIDLPDVSSLTYDPNDPTKLDIRVTLAETPASTSRSVIWIRTPGLTFTKVATGDRSNLSDDMIRQALVKAFNGELVIMADHGSADVSNLLLEGLITHIEGTKLTWMEDAELQALDVTSLTDGVEISQSPDRVVRSTVKFSYQGRLNLVRHAEALILKRHTIAAQASPSA